MTFYRGVDHPPAVIETQEISYSATTEVHEQYRAAESNREEKTRAIHSAYRWLPREEKKEKTTNTICGTLESHILYSTIIGGIHAAFNMPDNENYFEQP